VSNASFSRQQLSACRKAGEVSKHNPNPSASRHWAGNEEIGALGADRGPGWISFLESLADLEIPPLACWELQARCTKGLDGVGKTSVAQVDRSGSRVQKPIIASGQQRSPDAYEVQYSVVQYKALCSARPFSCPLGRCVVMISIPLSLLQYYSTLVSVNGDELDIVDSWIRGEISGPESPQVNWLAMWRKTWERRHSQTARRCQILANSGSARGILTEHDRAPVSVLPYLVPLCT
jgi:hypothetical protein